MLGHFSDDISVVLKNFKDKRFNVIKNTDINVELSQTLLNGVRSLKHESTLCLCVAADQPTVTIATMTKLIEKAEKYENPENIVSILARKEKGFLRSAEGLGMPFVCNSKLLLKYLMDHADNLNPILRKNDLRWSCFSMEPLQLTNWN